MHKAVLQNQHRDIEAIRDAYMDVGGRTVQDAEVEQSMEQKISPHTAKPFRWARVCIQDSRPAPVHAIM